MFHLSTKPVKRSAGRSATASAAYRSGCEIEDKRTGLKHDYSKKEGIVKTDCFIVANGQKVNIDRSELWNAAEQAENRKDGRTAREVIINLPHELNEQQRQSLVEDFTKDIAKKYRVAIDYAIHLPDKHGDQRNHHCHILMTTRTAKLENNILSLGDKTNIELSNTKLAKLELPKTQEQIVNLRKHWATTTNKHLENAGIDKRIDHRSYEEQNISAIPTIKLGWEASALERKGINTDKGDINRAIKSDNEKIKELELSIFMDKGRLSARTKIDAAKEKRAEQKADDENTRREREEIKPEPVAAPEPELSITEKYELWKKQREEQAKLELSKPEPTPPPTPEPVKEITATTTPTPAPSPRGFRR